MSDDARAPMSEHDVMALLDSSARIISDPTGEMGADGASRVLEVMATVERATPGGVGLHHQLDAVAKWLSALESPAEHPRFGGTAHVRDHVLAQLRRARAAATDYFRETK